MNQDSSQTNNAQLSLPRAPAMWVPTRVCKHFRTTYCQNQAHHISHRSGRLLEWDPPALAEWVVHDMEGGCSARPACGSTVIFPSRQPLGSEPPVARITVNSCPLLCCGVFGSARQLPKFISTGSPCQTTPDRGRFTVNAPLWGVGNTEHKATLDPYGGFDGTRNRLGCETPTPHRGAFTMNAPLWGVGFLPPSIAPVLVMSSTSTPTTSQLKFQIGGVPARAPICR
jgi:hypothetical protein